MTDNQTCDQTYVNIAVGAWWAISLVSSLFVISRQPVGKQTPDTEQPLLELNHASPVGFIVSSLPDFTVDPILEEKSLFPCATASAEAIFGVVLAMVGGAFMVYYSLDDSIDFFVENF